MDNQQVQQLEASIERNKADIAQLDALEHLFSNKYFQELILNGYLKEEAVRLVMLKADPNQQKPEHQAAIIRDIDAIGSLQAFLKTVKFKGDIARRSLDDDRDTLADILANP